MDYPVLLRVDYLKHSHTNTYKNLYGSDRFVCISKESIDFSYTYDCDSGFAFANLITVTQNANIVALYLFIATNIVQTVSTVGTIEAKRWI